jgi:PAS domain S-box-containing protein
MVKTTEDRPGEPRNPFRISWLGIIVSLVIFAGTAAFSTYILFLPFPGVALMLGIVYSSIVGGFISGVVTTALMASLMLLTTALPQLGIRVETTGVRTVMFCILGTAVSATFATLIARVKRAEAKLGRDERAVFRMVMENLHDAVVECDWKGIVEVNASVCRITGFTREELVGKQLPFPFVPRQSVAVMAVALEQAMRGERKEFRLALSRKNGDLFPALICISHFDGGSGGNLRTVYTIRDVSELPQYHG